MCNTINNLKPTNLAKKKKPSKHQPVHINFTKNDNI